MRIRNLKIKIKKDKKNQEIQKMNRDSGSQMDLIFEDNQSNVLKPLESEKNTTGLGQSLKK